VYVTWCEWSEYKCGVSVCCSVSGDPSAWLCMLLLCPECHAVCSDWWLCSCVFASLYMIQVHPKCNCNCSTLIANATPNQVVVLAMPCNHTVTYTTKSKNLILSYHIHSIIHFRHAPLWVRSAKHRHHSPEWMILSHINCFVQGQVQWFQVPLDSLHPCSMGCPGGLLQFSKGGSS